MTFAYFFLSLIGECSTVTVVLNDDRCASTHDGSKSHDDWMLIANDYLVRDTVDLGVYGQDRQCGAGNGFHATINPVQVGSCPLSFKFDVPGLDGSVERPDFGKEMHSWVYGSDGKDFLEVKLQLAFPNVDAILSLVEEVYETRCSEEGEQEGVSDNFFKYVGRASDVKRGRENENEERSDEYCCSSCLPRFDPRYSLSAPLSFLHLTHFTNNNRYRIESPAQNKNQFNCTFSAELIHDDDTSYFNAEEAARLYLGKNDNEKFLISPSSDEDDLVSVPLNSSIVMLDVSDHYIDSHDDYECLHTYQSP